MIGAMAFRSPAATVARAMSTDSPRARRGLLDGPLPAAKNSSRGSTRSSPRRCSTLGPPSDRSQRRRQGCGQHADDHVHPTKETSPMTVVVSSARIVAGAGAGEQHDDGEVDHGRQSDRGEGASGDRPTGLRSSPDMATPWLKPVTAGKKMAKASQKPTSVSGRPTLSARASAVELTGCTDEERDRARRSATP